MRICVCLHFCSAALVSKQTYKNFIVQAYHTYTHAEHTQVEQRVLTSATRALTHSVDITISAPPFAMSLPLVQHPVSFITFYVSNSPHTKIISDSYLCFMEQWHKSSILYMLATRAIKVICKTTEFTIYIKTGNKYYNTGRFLTGCHTNTKPVPVPVTF